MPDSESTEPRLVHRDEHLLIIDKPPGLPTTAPRPSTPSLTRWVEKRFPRLDAHPTSRLDAPVSGLVTFALSRPANRALLQARRAEKYVRLYIGITLEVANASDGLWTWPVSLHPHNPALRVAGPGRGQREATTRCEVAARTPNGALLRLLPGTGRTHQLRVHAAKAGMVLFGDRAYGGPRRLTLADGAVVTARRVMLHCAQVRFPWARDEERRFEAAVPADMTRAWLALGGLAQHLDAS